MNDDCNGFVWKQLSNQEFTCKEVGKPQTHLSGSLLSQLIFEQSTSQIQLHLLYSCQHNRTKCQYISPLRHNCHWLYRQCGRRRRRYNYRQSSYLLSFRWNQKCKLWNINISTCFSSGIWLLSFSVSQYVAAKSL